MAKMVELGVYADIPHLLTPIISNPKKAANALGWAVSEMDERYRVLAALAHYGIDSLDEAIDSGRLQLSGSRDQVRQFFDIFHMHAAATRS